MTERGPRTLRTTRGTAVLLGVASLGFALVLVASASGPVSFVSAPSLAGSDPPTTVTPTSGAVRASPSTTQALPPLPAPPALPAFVVLLIQLLAWGAVLLLLVLLLRLFWRHAPRWRARIQTGTEVIALPDVPEELTRSADARMALLSQGTPRNAIVACWLDLEAGAASVGLPRDPSETSAEYTTRVLATWEIAPDALSCLAELYREARFSLHALTEEHRAAAVARLTTLHDDLRRVADERAAARAPTAPAASDAGVGAGTGPQDAAR